MTSFSEVLKRVKASIREVSVDDTKARVLDTGGDVPVLIDVRERDEYEQGFLPKAEWVPRGFLELKVEDLVPEREREVIIYCAGGTRSPPRRARCSPSVRPPAPTSRDQRPQAAAQRSLPRARGRY